jgi:hypothetical protein
LGEGSYGTSLARLKNFAGLGREQTRAVAFLTAFLIHHQGRHPMASVDDTEGSKITYIQSDKSDDQIPSLFATIHFRSEQRPDGYTNDDIELLNIQANKHIPDLYEKLVRQREERLAREAEAENPSKASESGLPE